MQLLVYMACGLGLLWLIEGALVWYSIKRGMAGLERVNPPAIDADDTWSRGS